MAEPCHCCCRGRPRVFPGVPSLWKLALPSLGTIWWTGRFDRTNVLNNWQVEIVNGIAYEFGIADNGILSGESIDENEGASYTGIDTTDVVRQWRAYSFIDNNNPVIGIAENNEVAWCGGNSGGVDRVSLIDGTVIDSNALNMTRAWGIDGSTDCIVFNGSNSLIRYTNAYSASVTRTVTTVAPATTVLSTSPLAEKFATHDGTNVRIYDENLTQLQTTTTNDHPIRCANSTYVLTGDGTSYRLRLVSDLSEVWNVAIPGGFANSQTYFHNVVDSSGNCYVTEGSGFTTRLRKLNAADGSQAWTSTITTSSLSNPVRHVLYDEASDAVIVTGRIGGELCLSYDGTAGTLNADHKCGSAAGSNNISGRAAIVGGYVYVPASGGDPTRGL